MPFSKLSSSSVMLSLPEANLQMQRLEAEVLEFLATMADVVQAPAPKTSEGVPSSLRTVMRGLDRGGRLQALSSGPPLLKRKRTVSVGVHSKASEAKKVVLFPKTEQFKGVKPSSSYVSLLKGHSRWKKPVRETRSIVCGCPSMVSCTHNC